MPTTIAQGSSNFIQHKSINELDLVENELINALINPSHITDYSESTSNDNNFKILTDANATVAVLHTNAAQASSDCVSSITFDGDSANDCFTLNEQNSTILKAETITDTVTSPDNGVIFSSSSKITLTENDSDANTIKANDYLRKLNKEKTPNNRVVFSSMNTNALGVEGKILAYDLSSFEANYKTIPNANTFSSDNITVEYNRPVDTNNYDYKLYKVTHDAAKFNTVADTNSKVTTQTFNELKDNSNYSYTDITGDSYNNPNLSNTSSGYVKIETTGVEKSLSLEGTSPYFAESDLVNNKLNDLEHSSLNDLTFLNTYKMPDSVTFKLLPSSFSFGSTANIPSVDSEADELEEDALYIQSEEEVLPSGAGSTNGSVTFDSTDRVDSTTIINGLNLNPQVVYKSDGNTELIALPSKLMTDKTVTRSIERLQKATLSGNNTADRKSNNNNVDLYTDANNYTLTKGFIDSSNSSYLIEVKATTPMELGVEHHNNILLDPQANGNNLTIKTINVTGHSQSGLAKDYQISLIKNLLKSEPIISDSDVSIDYPNTIINASSLDTDGPIQYADILSLTSLTYTQKYDLVYPTSRELKLGRENIKNVLVNAIDSDENTLEGNVQFNIDSNHIVFSNYSSTVEGTLKTVNYTIKFHAALSGINNSDVELSVPISYSYDNVTGVISPGLHVQSFNITFNVSELFTHKAILQLQNSEGIWYDVSDKLIDLRLDDQFTLSGENITVDVSYLPLADQLVPIRDYLVTLRVLPESSGYTARRALLNNQTNLDIYTGLDQFQKAQPNIVSFFLNSNIVTTSPTVTITVEEGTYPTEDNFNLTVSGNTVKITGSPSDKTFYLLCLRTHLVKVTDTSANGTLSELGYKNYLLGNSSGLTKLDDGIYVNLTNIASGNTAKISYGSFSLKADKYTGVAYSGQNTQDHNGINHIINDSVHGKDSNNNIYLWNTPAGTVNVNENTVNLVTFGLVSKIYRGYKNGSNIQIVRGGISVLGQLGNIEDENQLIETQTVTVPSPGAPTLLTFNFGHNFGFNLKLTNTSNVEQSVTFTINKNTLKLTVHTDGISPDLTETISTPSRYNLSSVFSTSANVSFVDLLTMYNLSSIQSSTMVLNYIQGDHIIAKSSIYSTSSNSDLESDINSYVNEITFELVQTITDSNIRSVITPSFVMDNSFISLIFSNTNYNRVNASTKYICVAPLVAKLSLKTAKNTVTTRYLLFDKNTPSQQSVELDVTDGITSKHDIKTTHIFSSIVSQQPVAENFIFKPHTHLIKGCAEYINGDLSQYYNSASGVFIITFEQNGVMSGESLVHLTVSSNYNLRRVYKLDIVPRPNFMVTLYQLNSYLDTNRVIKHYITKYDSVPMYNDDETVNTSANSENGYIVKFTPSNGFVIKFDNQPSNLVPAFNESTANNWPSVDVPTVSESDYTVTQLTNLPDFLDFVVQVKGEDGISKLRNLLTPLVDKADIVRIYAPDAFVVKSQTGEAVLRVSPNGKLIVPDIVTNLIEIVDSRSSSDVNGINGGFTQVYNSTAQLAPNKASLSS
jgi:hypothetical protein